MIESVDKRVRMKLSRKRLLSLLLGLAVGLLLLALWLKYIDIDLLIRKIEQVRLELVVWASLFYLGAYLIRSLRWNLLLRKDVALSWWRTWLYSMGGNWVNYVIPIRLGELVKAWFVKRNHGVPILRVLPSIFIDKTFDTVGIFFVLAMLPFLGIKFSSGMIALLSLLALVFALSLIMLLLAARRKKGVVGFIKGLFAWLPGSARDKINRYIEIFISGLNVFEHRWTRLLSGLALTALGVLLDGLYFYLLFQAFSVQLPFLKVLFGYTLINMSYALPQPPVQLGSNEWMMIIIFSVGFALTRQDASAIMAFAHMLTAFLMSVVGIAAIALSGRQIITAILSGDKIYEQ